MIAAYRAARLAREEPAEAQNIWVALGTDVVFRWPSLQLAAAHVAGCTHFRRLVRLGDPCVRRVLGACHALELPFVFGAVHLPAVKMFSGAGRRS